MTNCQSPSGHRAGLGLAVPSTTSRRHRNATAPLNRHASIVDQSHNTAHGQVRRRSVRIIGAERQVEEAGEAGVELLTAQPVEPLGSLVALFDESGIAQD